MTIKVVEDNELEEISKLYVKVYTKFLPNERWTIETASRFIKYNYKKQPDLFFVAKEDGKIKGFTFGYIKPWSDGDQLMAEELVVDYDYHRQGIAKALTKKVNKYSI